MTERAAALAELSALLGVDIRDVQWDKEPAYVNPWGEPWRSVPRSYESTGPKRRGWRLFITTSWYPRSFESSDEFRQPARLNRTRALLAGRDNLPPLTRAQCRHVLRLMHEIHEMNTHEKETAQ